MSAITAWLARLPGERRDGVAVRWLILRLLGLVYLAAFVSLWAQVDGLIGSQGIAPAAQYVAAAREQLGASGWRQLPTVFWWDASDAALTHVFAAGTLGSVLLIIGIAPVPVLIGLQLLYLSVVHVGDVFLHFQWDYLLLETGFLAILYAPLGLMPRPSRERGPNVLFVLLLRWLIFRLMFSSGAVKLTSLDPHWADLTAMQFHFESQPLPPFTAWFFHQLPPFAHRLEMLATFVFELGIPFLAFGNRSARRAACAGFLALSAMILVTGNYGFFNWLTVALAITVLDDADLPGWLRRAITGQPEAAPEVRPGTWRRAVALAVAVPAFALSALHLLHSIDVNPPVPPVLAALDETAAPYALFNEYGLFRVMTIGRPEVEIEGSDDGVAWKPYVFRYKMGDPLRRPGFVAPHMPRLDWQMWFAALAGSGRQRWFVNFMIQLLRGSPAVLDLLESNPFPAAPPKVVRATLYDYAFTTPEERARTGAWWKRREIRAFFPPASLNK